RVVSERSFFFFFFVTVCVSYFEVQLTIYKYIETIHKYLGNYWQIISIVQNLLPIILTIFFLFFSFFSEDKRKRLRDFYLRFFFYSL
ncbi:hypothetical protein BY996DRAFT_6993894, partial [Phakopsora pachyrhizi]